MPIYEYLCLDCRSRFEALRPMAEADGPMVCQRCESEHTSRMLSVFHAHSNSKSTGSSSPASCACGGSCSCASLN